MFTHLPNTDVSFRLDGRNLEAVAEASRAVFEGRLIRDSKTGLLSKPAVRIISIQAVSEESFSVPMNRSTADNSCRRSRESWRQRGTRLY